MKCKNCSTELNGSEKFCGVCGAPVSAATPAITNQEDPLVSISDSGYAPYDVITAAHARATMANDDYREAKATVANLEEARALELKTYKSMNNIAKFGFILSILSTATSLLGSIFSATSILNFAELLVLSVLGPLASTAVLIVWIWGIFAIKEYATSHGWLVVFNLYFVLAVITLIVILAVFVGIPYYLKVRGNVNDCESALEMARNDLSQKEETLKAMAAI